MEYSTAYIIQQVITYTVGFVLAGTPALILLFLLYNMACELTACCFPRLLPKRAKQRTKRALALKYCEHATRRHRKQRGREMSYRYMKRQSRIIRQQVQKEMLHPRKEIDRNFFQKG